MGFLNIFDILSFCTFYTTNTIFLIPWISILKYKIHHIVFLKAYCYMGDTYILFISFNILIDMLTTIVPLGTLSDTFIGQSVSLFDFSTNPH